MRVKYQDLELEVRYDLSNKNYFHVLDSTITRIPVKDCEIVKEIQGSLSSDQDQTVAIPIQITAHGCIMEESDVSRI